MRIEFINHSSICIELGEIRLLCDPWLEGRVFQDGWELLCPSRFTYDDFTRVTHIWFSHEHPDHFFPPNIKKIPAEYRSKIVAIYHETQDKKVWKFLQSAGFKAVIELKPFIWYQLSHDLTLMCNPTGHDSWLVVKGEDKTLLNLNDCYMRSKGAVERVRKLVGDVTVLLSQFSYAEYCGNKNEPEKRKASARNKLNSLALQAEVLRPKFFIPFASFVSFCHEENFHMNDQVNTVDEVFEFMKKFDWLETVVMSCGRIWDMSAAYTQTPDAIAEWSTYYEKMRSTKPSVHSRSWELEELQPSINKFIQMASQNEKLWQRLRCLPPLIIQLTDLNHTTMLSCEGLCDAEANTSFEVAISSEVLDYCLRFNWGFNTTLVNGRVEFQLDGLEKFKRWARLADDMNHQTAKPGKLKRILTRCRRELASYGLTKTVSLERT